MKYVCAFPREPTRGRNMLNEGTHLTVAGRSEECPHHMTPSGPGSELRKRGGWTIGQRDNLNISQDKYLVDNMVGKHKYDTSYSVCLVCGN